MKAPAFQFYPQDFVSSLDVQIMSVEQVGGYILLLINSWIQEKQGYLPDDENILKRLCRMNDKQWDKNKDSILKKFKKEDGYLFNPRLMQELQKQAEYREKQAQNGQKGGRPKKEENPDKAVGFSGETQCKAKKSSSSSSSSSKNIIGARPKDLNEVVSYFIEKRVKNHLVKAKDFFDFYEANGWVQGKSKKPIKNWKAAVTTWKLETEPAPGERRILGFKDVVDMDDFIQGKCTVLDSIPIYEGDRIPPGMRKATDEEILKYA